MSKLFRKCQEMPNVKPFFSIDYYDDNEILSWFSDTHNVLTNYYQPLFSEQKNNLKIFLNTNIDPNYLSPLVTIYINEMINNNDIDEININEMYLLVMEQVSTIVSNQLTSQVIPNNDDYKDKIAAKFVKMWLDSISYDLNIDIKRVQWETQKKIFGESFIIPEWNPNKGSLHPMLESDEIIDDEIPAVDEDGRTIINSDGNPEYINKYQRIGDIEIKNPMPFNVMIDPQEKFSKSDWFYYIEYENADTLRYNYKNIDFEKQDKKYLFDSTYGFDKSSEGHIEVFHFTHRSTPYLPEGRKIVLTKDHVLVNESMKKYKSLIDSQSLPLVRFCDLDVGIGVRGIPISFRNARPAVFGYNEVTNRMYENAKAESPKILINENSSVDAQRLPEGIIVMEYSGNFAPSFVTPVANTSSTFKFREDLKKNIIELGGQTPMVRGDTPNAQLDSFIALQHFEDQRIQLATPEIKSHLNGIEHLYRFLIAIAQDNYDPEDQRLIKIVGSNNKYNIKYFDPDNLNKVYDVKITSTGNLANSKAAQTQLYMTIKREMPHLVSDEKFVDLLGLSSIENFQNNITIAVNSAESENEDMLNGLKIDPPERYEDLITHWDTHRIPLQSREFKTAPKEIQLIFEMHMTATEKLMYEQAAESDSFASRLASLRQFPLYFSPFPTNAEQEEKEGEIAVEESKPIPDEIIEVNRNENMQEIPDMEIV